MEISQVLSQPQRLSLIPCGCLSLLLNYQLELFVFGGVILLEKQVPILKKKFMLAVDNQNKLQVGVQDFNMTNLKRSWETERASQMQQNGTATKNGD